MNSGVSALTGSALRDVQLVSSKSIAVLIPCYNEEKTVADVVKSFKKVLPNAAIYVFDNNSTDDTVSEAINAGAIIGHEKRQGKGHVMRTMLRQIEADIYIMVDGDGTYPADKIHELLEPIITGDADMVMGSRLHKDAVSTFKVLNRIGNHMFLKAFNSIFRVNITDLLTGYRVFTKAVAKCLPIMSIGFEIETELTAKCIESGYRVKEIAVNLSSRPEGSKSKIKIVRDGLLIMKTIFALFRDYKPLTAFGLFGVVLICLGLFPGLVVVREFIMTGYIERVPSAILSVGLVLSGLIFAFVGLVLHTIARRFQALDSQIKSMNEMFLRRAK